MSVFGQGIIPSKRYKSPGSAQIPAELIQAGGKILRSKIHKLITSVWHLSDIGETMGVQ
jgi:hypothetical protein